MPCCGVGETLTKLFQASPSASPDQAKAKSQAEDRPDDRSMADGPDLDELLNNIVDNEDMVKLLEDMRDDMLKDMKIPPLNDGIADAAKKLGSPDGTITKDIYDKAKIILDPIFIEVNNSSNSSPIAAITGNGKIDGDFLKCNEVTNAMMGEWNLVADEEGILTPDELHNQGSGTATSDAQE